MIKFFSYVNKIRPRPFKAIQSYLNVEPEWANFKVLIKPHKFKMLTLGFIATYPLYRSYLHSKYQAFNIDLQSKLEKEKPVTKIAESFLKQVVDGVLKDPQIRREAGSFVENLARRQVVLDAVVNLLAESVKDPEFLAEAKGLTKYLTNSIINDKVVEQDLVALVANLFRDPEVRYELVEALKWMMAQDETKKAFAELGKNGFADEKMQVAMKNLVSNAFYEVLVDKETVDKIKLFAIYMMEQDATQTDQGPNMKKAIDTIMAKWSKGYKGEQKDNEVRKTLKTMGIEEVFDAVDQRKHLSKAKTDADATDEDDDGGKNYFFI
jgi:hypothetical protein